nr:hypothetical protein [Aneurinibacillus sp. XH2]
MKKHPKPENPGMSEKAWDELHRKLQKYEMKHRKKLLEKQKKAI